MPLTKNCFLSLYFPTKLFVCVSFDLHAILFQNLDLNIYRCGISFQFRRGILILFLLHIQLQCCGYISDAEYVSGKPDSCHEYKVRTCNWNAM